MIRSLLEDGTVVGLERALDGAAVRQQVLANNIANVNTPGFKRSDVGFSGRFLEALAGDGRSGVSLLSAAARGRGAGPLGPRPPRGPQSGAGDGAGDGAQGVDVVTDSRTSGRNDGNNVDIEVEMAHMSENSLWYQALVRQVSEKFERLRLAVTEGRR